MIGNNFIVDDIGEVVQSIQVGGAPYYMYGHRREIASRLLVMEKDLVYKFQKYPLIALRLDIPERVSNGMVEFRLNIAILDFTKKNYNAEERYTNVIKPVLYPIYRNFMTALITSGKFTWNHETDGELPEHTKVDRPYWGTSQEEGNAKDIFNDPLDAIEIIDLKLLKDINQC